MSDYKRIESFDTIILDQISEAQIGQWMAAKLCIMRKTLPVSCVSITANFRDYRNDPYYAPREFRWQFLFPSAVRRGQYRWHMTKEHIASELKAAVDAAGIIKRITPHTLRHAFCTHGLRAGNDAPTMQELMGHEDMNTTAMYSHADRANGISPMDVALKHRQTTIFVPEIQLGRISFQKT